MGITLCIKNDSIQCSAPQGALTASIIEQISDHKKKLINYFHKKNNQFNVLNLSKNSEQDIEKPASFIQEYLWAFVEHETNAAYNMPVGFFLEGNLQYELLNHSIKKIFQRHAVLRTYFKQDNNQLAQHILAAPDWELPVMNLENYGAKAEIIANNLFMKEEQEPISLYQWPLFRLHLLKLGNKRHVLLVNFHQAVFDMWSWDIFFRELKFFYDKLDNSDESGNLLLTKQYFDYAENQRAIYNSKREFYQQYWQTHFIKMIESSGFLTKKPFKKWSYKGAEAPVLIPESVTIALRKICKSQKVTIFVFLLAVIAIVISAQIQSFDFVIAAPISDRQLPEYQNLIGPFLTTLLIPINLKPELSFINFLAEVRKNVMEAYKYCRLPIEAMFAREKGRSELLSNKPLLKIMFNYQEYLPDFELSLSGLKVERLHADTVTVKSKLFFSLKARQSDICGRVEYSTEEFDYQYITNMVNNLRGVIDEIIINQAVILTNFFENR